jgi:chitodextrinase
VTVAGWTRKHCSYVSLLLAWLIGGLYPAPVLGQTPAIAFVQVNSAVPQTPQVTVTVPFSLAETSGNLNVVVAGWNDSTARITSVVDSKGNPYILAVGPTIRPGFASQAIYYAKNIQQATAGSNVVSVTFDQPATYVDVRIAEYRGLDPVNPIDVVAASQGISTSTNSGSITTTNANDLLIGANLVATRTTGPGAGYTRRIITSPDGDILEDRVVTAIGSYNAIAPVAPAGDWIMQMVAFKAAPVGPPDTQLPTAPANLVATAATATQVNLSWTGSTDNVGVSGYRIERCLGAGCSNFAQIATTTNATYSDPTAAGSSSYGYRVRATDLAGNLSDYSNVATATTPASPDTQAPTVPTSVAAVAVSSSQINLSWTASTDNVGVTSYLVERCQGTGCATFAQVGTSATPSYTDNSASASTSYSYRVRASDLANNLSGYSNVSSVTTPAAPDTQAPTAPTGLTGTSNLPTQVALNWTASTDNVGVTSYLVERCQGTGCATFAQVGTSATPSYTDNGASGSTSYSYRVRATDLANNLSGYSNVSSVTTPAAPDTQAPTAPTSVTATAVSSSQINLAWTAATDNVGVTGYLIERCQGSGCATFAQIGTTAATTFSSTGLAGTTSYSYRVRATDAAGNSGPFSTTVSATTPGAPAIAFVQVNSAVPQSPVASVAVPFTAAQGSGDLNVVVVGWNAPSGQVQSVTDTSGNAYALAVGPTVKAGFATQSIYYSANIRAAAAGANIVTVTFAAAVPYPDIRIAEYTGIISTSPVDGVAAASGDSALANSGSVVTANATDLIVGANMVSSLTTGAGTGFTARVITSPDGDILEDRIVSATGSYNATAPLPSGSWIMQLVAFKAGAATPDTVPPTAPTSLAATPISGTQVTLAWTASTDNVAVTGYRVERCQGAGCSTFAEIGTSTTLTYTDTGISAASTYAYRVRATDAAFNLGPYSNVAPATTPAPDTEAPSAPGVLTATAVSGTQIDVAWGAATDNTGVAGYRLERCQGTGCTAFTKFGTTITSTSFSDVGLSVNTSYTYIVRAQDAAGNLGPYSNVASATTLATNPNLVAAYSFDEGTGTAVADFSGHSNTGSVVNAVWTTAGKFGKALLFNGSNAVVTVPDAASLKLTSGMTLEAWVNPTAVNTGWKDIIYKGNDNYYLEGSSPSGAPMIGITIGAAQTEVFGTNPLPTNTWTFLAATYDGATLRFFVNGTQVSAQARTGNIVTSNNPLQIGGDSIWGQFFQGIIDEVRVYNVALTPGQIQADMATALGGSSPAVSLSALSLDFGNQAVSTASVPRAVAVTNGGTATLNLTGISLSGAQAADFAQTNDCAASLAPGSSCTINVTFTPASTGTRNGSLLITDNAPGNPHSVSLVGTGTGFGISPQTAVATPGQTQQFTVSGAGTSPVVWSVDGIAGGGVASGTITAAGLYTPPAANGTHVINVATTDGARTATATVFVTTSAGMFTHHNDDARTGQNLNETVLSPSTVTSASFGKLAEYSIDGIAHASPLYVANVNIPGVGLKNVVYVATEHDSVYAFDADIRTPTPLWHRSFLGTGVTTVPNGDTGECCDIAPEIGITGTPVIDPATQTLYVVVKTKEGTGNYPQRLHALDLSTGAEKFGGPVLIQASVPGTGTGSSNGQLPFNSLRENQRTALLLRNGVVYFGFGSHGDFQPYHGWLLGYNATTLQRTFVFNATPNGEGGGIWQSGGGMAMDAAGNFYFGTGDGTFTANGGGVDYGDTFVRLTTSGSVADWFTPHDETFIDNNNLDLDAGGMILLPDQPGPHPHLLVSAGKNGTIYVVDRDNMGRFNAVDRNVQTLANVFPFGTPLPGNYSSPVYFNGNVYFAPVADVVQMFKLTNGLLSTSSTSTTAQAFAYPGASLAISSNGNTAGILWAVRKNGAGPGTLHAYEATNLAVELYNSDQAGARDRLDVAAKFSVPLVINGRVYVASEGKLTIYGLLP